MTLFGITLFSAVVLWCLILIVSASFSKPPKHERTLSEMDQERHECELEANDYAWLQAKEQENRR